MITAVTLPSCRWTGGALSDKEKADRQAHSRRRADFDPLPFDASAARVGSGRHPPALGRKTTARRSRP